MLARVLRSEEGYLYPEELADEGIGEKIRLIIPVGFPIIPAGFGGRGYRRQNQVDYTHWLIACEGMGDKTRLIIPADLRGQGYGR